jgi:hypothetical protein
MLMRAAENSDKLDPLIVEGYFPPPLLLALFRDKMRRSCSERNLLTVVFRSAADYTDYTKMPRVWHAPTHKSKYRMLEARRLPRAIRPRHARHP